jgi:DNA mismatch repair protein MutS2
MEFDAQLLQPKYRLIMGKAGSSFTFEVAESNGIPTELLERARKKIDSQKLKWDQLLLELEKEKQALTQQLINSEKQQKIADQKIEQYDKKNNELQALTQKKTQLWDKEQIDIQLAKKMKQFITGVKSKGKNQELWDEMKKFILMEHAKLESQRKKDQIKKQKSQIKEEEESTLVPLTIADLVKIKQTKQVGIVTKIEDKGVTVIIGNFKTLISRDKLVKI